MYSSWNLSALEDRTTRCREIILFYSRPILDEKNTCLLELVAYQQDACSSKLTEDVLYFLRLVCLMSLSLLVFVLIR